MKFTDVSPESIWSVLLSDGWHKVAAEARFEFVHATVTSPEIEWFRFTEQLPATTSHSGGKTVIAGPLSSILAIRLRDSSKAVPS